MQNELKDDDRRQGFHIDKSISIGHIISTVTIIIWLITWGSSVETRISVNSTEIKAGQAASLSHIQIEKEGRQEIRQQLYSINDKIDRLVERQSK